MAHAEPGLAAPDRIRQLTAHLPAAPGVYLFWGDQSGPTGTESPNRTPPGHELQTTLPLYIGKSIDIRTRVLSHFRAPDEARMMGLTQRIECTPTAGEIGALLLEAQLIKRMNPLFNVRLRRLRKLVSWRLEAVAGGLKPVCTDGHEAALGVEPGWYGLFSSRHAAQAQLRNWADEHRLCHALLGLEASSRRGCFGWQIKRCAGACVGQEPRLDHDARLRAALESAQVAVWPFATPVDVIERLGDWEQRHRVWRWRHLGSWCSRESQAQGGKSGLRSTSGQRAGGIRPPAGTTTSGALGAPDSQPFDLDSYKILMKPILLGGAAIEPVGAARGNRG
jgi:excinuclease Cho